ncbi:uncharacterized protein LOC126354671 [Schistocerca gregaria]|uniref:uncharacterized protein LOC126354671 n=1 Tax=Schistocerca gregaria TaxID=7010 RepID=UPI00211EA254|nr:uncharacterized protein LOC126354671 [Schistocerca gregaria]
MQDCKFYIRSTNTDFVEKQRNILNLINAFDQEKHEKEKEDPDRSCAEPMEVDSTCERVSLKRKRSETKHFRGKESIFKKPIDFPPRFRVRDIPDHQRNPHKWVKYTLGDVSPDDMTNQSNTAAALSFLRELEERKQKQTPEGNKEEVRRIIFKPSHQVAKKTSEQLVEETSNASRTECLKTSVFRSSKLVMPEYVVGMEKKTRPKKIKKDNSQSTLRKVSLNHLYENEDE